LDLVPTHVRESEVAVNFGRAISHLAVMSPGGPVMVTGTTDGNIRVATVGVAFENYNVETDVAPDAWNVAQTYELVVPALVTDFLIETFAAEIQFRDLAGIWGDTKALPVGQYSYEYLHYGVRIQNRVALSISDFQITTYW